MDIEQLIVPTGILSFALFALAFVTGLPRFRRARLHAAAGYACCLVVLGHTAAALWCHMIEPLGLLGTAGMVLTAGSGRRRGTLRAHVALAVVTLIVSALHVALILFLQRR